MKKSDKGFSHTHRRDGCAYFDAGGLLSIIRG